MIQEILYVMGGLGAVSGLSLLYVNYKESLIDKSGKNKNTKSRHSKSGSVIVTKDDSMSEFGNKMFLGIDSIKEGEFYPKKHSGFGFVSGEQFVKENHYLIARIKDSLSLGGDFEKYILPLIIEYANYIQMVPASKNEHHRLAGGLFTHSLEVGLFATNKLYSKIFMPEEAAQDRIKREEFWKTGVFIAGLLHDAGKIVTDIIVTNTHGVQWNPFGCSLYDWGIENDFDGYRFAFNSKRKYKAHDTIGSQITSQIIPDETKRFIFSGGDDIYLSIISVLSGEKASAHPIMFEAVKEADAESSKKDMVNYTAPSETNRQLTKADHLMMAVARLIENEDWKVNEVGAKIFVTKYGVFIPWISSATNEILFHLDENGVKGFPKDPETLKNMLLHDGKIKGKTNEKNAAKWAVSMNVPIKNGKTQEITLSMSQILDPVVLDAVAEILSEKPHLPVLVESKLSARDKEFFLTIYTKDSLVDRKLVEKTESLEEQKATASPEKPKTEENKALDGLPANKEAEDNHEPNNDFEALILNKPQAKIETDSNRGKSKKSNINQNNSASPLDNAHPLHGKDEKTPSTKPPKKQLNTKDEVAKLRKLKREGAKSDVSESELENDQLINEDESKIVRNFSNKEKEWFEDKETPGEIIIALGNKLIKEHLIFGEDVFPCDLGLAFIWPKTFENLGLEKDRARQLLIDNGWVENNHDKPNSSTKIIEMQSPNGNRVKAIVFTQRIKDKFLQAFVDYEPESVNAKKKEHKIIETKPQKQPQKKVVSNVKKEQLNINIIIDGLLSKELSRPTSELIMHFSPSDNGIGIGKRNISFINRWLIRHLSEEQKKVLTMTKIKMFFNDNNVSEDSLEIAISELVLPKANAALIKQFKK